MNKNSQSFGIVLIFVGALLIGLMPSAAKFAYQDGANALFVLLGRSIIGVGVIFLFIIFTGRRAAISAANLRLSFVSGMTHIVAAIGILASIVYIDISLANIILFLFPFPIAIIAHFRGETPLTLPTMALMLLAIAGLALVLGVDFSSTDPRGIAIAVMGMFGFTFMIIVMTDLTKVVGAPNSNLLMTIWAVIVFALVSILGPLSAVIDPPQLPQSSVGWVAVVTVGITFSLGYLCFFISANIIGAARASLLSISEPVMIILMAVIVVGESLSAVEWSGVVLVISSLALTEVTRGKTIKQTSQGQQ